MVQQGDIVRFLNDVGGGRVSRVAGNMAYVEDEDGFETPVLVRECVVVQKAADVKAAEKARKEPVFASKPEPKATAPAAPKQEAKPKVVETVPVLEDEEVEGGDILNVVLAFEAENLKELGHSDYDAYLVNDSNYYLYFNLSTRADDSKEWTMRYAGVVEPNIQLLLGTFDSADIATFDNIAVQYIAFKRSREFALKQPALVEHRADTTKFFKLHCFRENPYFDTPVIAFDIVTDDKPFSPKPIVDSRKLETEMMNKKRSDMRPVRKRVSKPKAAPGEILVVDLHIAELVDSTRGLSNADMLNLQVDKFREVMDANLRNFGQKIVFIHGKGEGVLRQALMKELNHRYKGHDVQDASFQEYGYGATQVTIRQIQRK